MQIVRRKKFLNGKIFIGAIIKYFLNKLLLSEASSSKSLLLSAKTLQLGTLLLSSVHST